MDDAQRHELHVSHTRLQDELNNVSKQLASKKQFLMECERKEQDSLRKVRTYLRTFYWWWESLCTVMLVYYTVVVSTV